MDDAVQDYGISIAKKWEILQPCAKPLLCAKIITRFDISSHYPTECNWRPVEVRRWHQQASECDLWAAEPLDAGLPDWQPGAGQVPVYQQGQDWG